jgi:hypothetical protein
MSAITTEQIAELGEPEITIDDVLRVLTQKKPEVSREEWLEKAEKQCAEWGPVVLCWAAGELQKSHEERNALRAEVERLRAIIQQEIDDYRNEYRHYAANQLVSGLSADGKPCEGEG